MTCTRYHIEIKESNCLAYQALWDKTFPAVHPCQGCEQRIEKKKRPVAIQLRQGGRHKSAIPKPPKKANGRPKGSGKMVLVEEKTCRRCGESKASEEFYRMQTTKDRLRPYCKKCDNATRAERKRA